MRIRYFQNWFDLPVFIDFSIDPTAIVVVPENGKPKHVVVGASAILYRQEQEADAREVKP